VSSARPRIYLDNNATTRPAPEVVEAMLPFLREDYANPSSPSAAGRRAASAVWDARERTAALLDVDPTEVVFTSGATESNNAALWMALRARRGRRRVAISAVEHPCVRRVAERAAARGFGVDVLPVDRTGQLDLEACRARVNERTAVVSVMTANNETGVCLPVAAVAAIAHQAGALMHTDAVQTAGRLPLRLRELGIDLAAVSGHKMHGPKGVGALVLRGGEDWEPFLAGGDQERGRRAGTENVAGIVGLGAAAELARDSVDEWATEMQRLRDRLEHGILSSVPETEAGGAGAPRLPNTAAIRFDGIAADMLIARLDMEGIAVSSGSACAAGSMEPSPVWQAMGRSAAEALRVIRFSLSRYTTEDEIDIVRGRLPELVAVLRSGSPAQPRV
jgi:cysteine desulfurase